MAIFAVWMMCPHCFLIMRRESAVMRSPFFVHCDKMVTK